MQVLLLEHIIHQHIKQLLTQVFQNGKQQIQHHVQQEVYGLKQLHQTVVQIGKQKYGMVQLNYGMQ